MSSLESDIQNLKDERAHDENLIRGFQHDCDYVTEVGTTRNTYTEAINQLRTEFPEFRDSAKQKLQQHHQQITLLKRKVDATETQDTENSRRMDSIEAEFRSRFDAVQADFTTHMKDLRRTLNTRIAQSEEQAVSRMKKVFDRSRAHNKARMDVIEAKAAELGTL
jgi:chromosome segregation ATPase